MPTSRFQPSFAAGVLGPGLHGRIDIAKYDVGLKVGKNVFVHAHGGVSNRAGTEFICEVMDSEKAHRLLPFVRDDDENYILLFGDLEMKIIENGAVVLDGGIDYNPSTPYSSALLDALDYVQSVDVMFFAHNSIFPNKMSRLAEFDWSFSDIEIEPQGEVASWIDVGAVPPPTGVAATNATEGSLNNFFQRSYDYTYVVSAVLAGDEGPTGAPVTLNDCKTLSVSDFSTISWTPNGSDTYKVYRKSGTFYGLVGETAGSSLIDDGSSFDEGQAPTSQISVSSAASGSKDYAYVISPIINGIEGFPTSPSYVYSAQDLSEDDALNTITWVGDADSYNVYRERNGVFGYIGFTENTTFKDDNISPDLTVSPIEAVDVFQTPNDYPGKVAIFQQRLVFANSINQPETLWMSQTGNYESFARSRILRDTDRIEIDLSGQQVNRIRSMMPLRELMVFSSAGEFTVSGPNGVMLATNPVQTQYGYSGASSVKPLVVEDTAIFVDRTGRSVRDLRYAFEQDGYTGNDLTIFSSQFFENRKIMGWCYAKNPFSVIWVYLDNGKLLSFTYKREHQVWAWCEHDIGGKVESIACIPEENEDAVYMIVNRTIDGGVKRYVERMHSRDFLKESPADCFFVDCGLTYSGAPATVISGLDHLEGETVVALADGDVVEGLVVSGGQVTLRNAASIVHVGLGYEAEIENLPPAIDLQDVGSARGRPMKASRIFLQLEKTRGIEVSSTNREKFSAVVQTAVDLALDIPLFTGMVDVQLYPDWNKDGTIVVRQRYPLPMTVLGISPELSVGRSG